MNKIGNNNRRLIHYKEYCYVRNTKQWKLMNKNKGSKGLTTSTAQATKSADKKM